MKTIVFDVDGTLADLTHRRDWVVTKPKNWKAFNATMHLDTPHEDIIWLLHTIQRDLNTRTVICSGRGSEHRAVTEKWLANNGIEYSALYMRNKGDFRNDDIIKVELLDQIIYDYGVPYLWFDDRNRVVDAVRARGIRVLQVAPGDF